MATSNLARVYSAELEGIDALRIEVEVDLNVGLHSFNIVGLADKALNEAKERVNSALKNSGVKPPNRENRKITVNLAPADVKKTGAQYDLAIAVGYLLASQQIKPFSSEDVLFAGELALNGAVRPVSGALSIAELAAKNGYHTLFVPAENAEEAAVVESISVIPVSSLTELIALLEGALARAPHRPIQRADIKNDAPDFSEVKGQERAKRALAIAAAGGHNLLMVGPPGVGKSLLARALAGILPPLSKSEAIELTKIYSAAGIRVDGLIATRPFRAPHQTASLIAIVGGGTHPKPGEISLAHRGVLFLDELPEFPKNILEALRQPMESGTVHVARARGSLVFPAKFTLVAAMNPCPCGYYGDPERECKCAAYEVMRYQKKISGPLLDRIDLQIHVPHVAIANLRGADGGAESATLRTDIERARRAQEKRFSKATARARTNAEMSSKETENLANLSREAAAFVETLEGARLSPRGYYRLLKTARTIADIASSNEVSREHLAEAFSYRLREEF